MKTIGYARVSTDKQTTALQRDALAALGIARLYEDKASGVRKRPALEQAIAALGPGDTLVVWRLDRLGRSLPDLLGIVASIKDKGAHLRSLDGKVDTTTASGRLVFHIFATLAEYERDLLRERTRAGLDAAKKRGTKLGRPHAINPTQLAQWRKLIAAGESPRSIARANKLHHSTIYRALRAAS